MYFILQNIPLLHKELNVHSVLSLSTTTIMIKRDEGEPRDDENNDACGGVGMGCWEKDRQCLAYQ